MMNMKIFFRKYLLSTVRNKLCKSIIGEYELYQRILERYSHATYINCDFDFYKLKNDIIKFIECRRIGYKAWEYGYSNSSPYASIYTASYALLLKSMLYGEGAGLSQAEHSEFSEYFLSMQDKKTGYFIDRNLEDGEYISKENNNNEWWGYGHTLLQVIPCLEILNIEPKYEFSFLDKYYDLDYLYKYLSRSNWGERIAYTGNSIMNIWVPLQYLIKRYNNESACKALQVIKEFLLATVMKNGLWGTCNYDNNEMRSQMIQGAYHWLGIFFYNNEMPPHYEKLVDTILEGQNEFGGFGANRYISSGCEDIDSIEPLCRCYNNLYSEQKERVEKALKFSLIWVLSNHQEDGGFVFQHGLPFKYGHRFLYSKKNESSMFATWWRLLCLKYIFDCLKIDNDMFIIDAPGYVY